MPRVERYVGCAAAASRSAFDDHGTLVGIGFDAVINAPMLDGGRGLGAFNIHNTGGAFAKTMPPRQGLIATGLC